MYTMFKEKKIWKDIDVCWNSRFRYLFFFFKQSINGVRFLLGRVTSLCRKIYNRTRTTAWIKKCVSVPKDKVKHTKLVFSLLRVHSKGVAHARQDFIWGLIFFLPSQPFLRTCPVFSLSFVRHVLGTSGFDQLASCLGYRSSAQRLLHIRCLQASQHCI